MLTKGVLISKIELGEILAHHGDCRRARLVTLVDVAPCDNRNLHGLQESWTYHQHAIRICSGSSVYTEPQTVTGSNQRLIRETHLAHTRYGSKPLQQVAIKHSDFRISVTGFPGIQLEEQ